MGYEERMDAMHDHNAEQQAEGQAEGRTEVLNELAEYFSLQPQKIFTKEDILEIISDFDG